MPLDVFEAYEKDAYHIKRIARGEPENPAELFDRMARDRVSASTPCPWWSDQ